MTRPRGLTYLFFGINPWRTIKQRSQHLAQGLAARNQVVYVNPIPDPLGIFGSMRRTREADASPLRGLLSDTRRHLFGTLASGPGLQIIDVPGLPGSHLLPNLHDLEFKWLCDVITECMRRQGNAADVLWISHPKQVGALRLLSSGTVCCYDCMDDYAGMASEGWRARILRDEKSVLSRADIVFVTSRALEERCRKYARMVVRVPNGVEFDHFSGTAAKGRNSRASGAKPVLGFFGWIGSWTDLELIREIAAARPDWVIRMIGPVHNAKFKDLESMENVEFIGQVPYERLPEYAGEFDVCIMPFVADELAKSVNPVKLYEYLATGKPIVSTDLPDVGETSPLVRIASDSKEFIARVEESLLETDPTLQERRRRIARENTWNDRISDVEKEIERERNRRVR